MDKRRSSLAMNLAEFLRARPNQWVDGRQLAHVAGFAGWRGRISDVRRPPFSMDVRNRQRRVRVDDHFVRVTEYRYEPPVTTRQDSRPAKPHQPGLWP